MNIKNNQKGFAAQGMVIIIAIAVIAGIAYYFGTKNVVAPRGNDVVVNATTTQNTQPTISVLSPNGGENWKIGQTYKIVFEMGGDLGMKTVRLNRYSDDGVRVGSTIVGTTNTDNLSFKIPVGTEDTKGAAARYKIQVIVDKYADGRGVADESDNYFSITPATVIQPSLTILSPNGGEVMKVESSDMNAVIPVRISFKDIQGISASLIDSSGVVVSAFATDNRDNGTLLQFYVNQQKTVSTIKPGQYKVKVCDYTNSNCDFSDSSFTIIQSATMPSIAVLSPNGGEVWKMGSKQVISWKPIQGKIVDIKIESKENCVLEPCLAPPAPGTNMPTASFSPIIAKAVSNSGTFEWTVGQYSLGGNSQTISKGGLYKITICPNVFDESRARSSYPCDVSDNYFTIIN